MKTPPLWIILGLFAVVVWSTAVHSSAVGQSPSQQSADSKVGLVEIPQPNLAGVDQQVQEQIRAAQTALAASLQRSNSSSIEKATAFGSLGEIYQAYGFDDSALACFRNAARLQPRSFRWHYYAGYLTQRIGDAESALREYQRAATLKPNDANTMVRLGNLELDANHPDLAKSWFLKSMAQRNPSPAAALNGLGKIALMEHRYPAALKYFKEALAREPQASRIHYQLAMTYRGLGDLRRMQENMQVRGDLEPAIHDPLLDEIGALKQGKVGLLERASAAIRDKRFGDAITAYRQLISLYPNDPIAHTYLGVALAKAGRSSEALQQYQEASQLDPQNSLVHYDIGILLIGAGKEDLAIAQFREAIRLDPGLAASHFQMANLLMRQKSDEEAGREYGIVASLQPQNGFARLMQAMASVHAGAYAQARSVLEEASLALPKDPDIANALARLLVASPDSSVRDQSRGLQIIELLVRNRQGDSFEEGITLAMALAGSGRFEEAAETQRAIIHEVEALGKHDLARLLDQNLNLYEHEKPCRRPWTSDDPIFTPVPNKPQLSFDLKTTDAR
jgi:tetratricopeptide (TPR) repeat protein